MNTGQQIIIGLSILLGAGYVLASAYNRRRGLNTFRWLQAGLRPIGKISEARWIGTSGSGARLVVANADRPFRRVEIAFLLESRELLPLWLFNHYLRHRRDLMIFKADLRTVPTGELEILRRGRRKLARMAGGSRRNPWRLADGEHPAGLMAAERGRYTDRMHAALRDWLETYGSSVKRLSVARTSPHLILEIDLPLLTVNPGAEFFSHLKETVVRLARAREADAEQ